MKVKKTAAKKAANRTKPAPITVSGDIELLPDGWENFEKLIKSAAKMGHKPHLPKNKKKQT